MALGGVLIYYKPDTSYVVTYYSLIVIKLIKMRWTESRDGLDNKRKRKWPLQVKPYVVFRTIYLSAEIRQLMGVKRSTYSLHTRNHR